MRDMRRGRARTFLLAIVLASVAAAPVFAFQGSAPKRIPLSSGWIDARHGWSGDGEGGARWSDDGGRTWRVLMDLGRFQLEAVRTSPKAAISGFVTGCCGGPLTHDLLWTNDAGKHWYLDGPPMSRGAFAGRGNLLFWHDGGDTLYRVEGWPPRGVYPCDEVEPGDLGVLMSGKLCRAPSDHGMRSVSVASLDRGAFGGMRALPDGIFAHVYDPVAESSHAAVYRQGSLSLEQLPAPVSSADDERALAPPRLAADWPRLYVLSDLHVVASRRAVWVGTVLWRSGDGGKTWTVTVARALPSRAYRVPGPARILSRTPLPGGYVASARVSARLALVIRQLDRTRPLLALPGSAKCSALQLRVDWPNIFVEGRRGGSTRAIWLSQDGGYRWTRFAVHRRARGSC
jgi:hypothetical protein